MIEGGLTQRMWYSLIEVVVVKREDRWAVGWMIVFVFAEFDCGLLGSL